jgi:hypothetical protein
VGRTRTTREAAAGERQRTQEETDRGGDVAVPSEVKR